MIHKSAAAVLSVLFALLTSCTVLTLDPLKLKGEPVISLTSHYILFDGPDLSLNNNGDGLPQAGETLSIDPIITNQGKATALGISGRLIEVEPSTVIFNTSESVFGNLQPEYYLSVVNTEEKGINEPYWINNVDSQACFYITVPAGMTPGSIVKLYFLFTMENYPMEKVESLSIVLH